MTLAVHWFSVGATSIVLLIAAGIVAGMVMILRAVTSDSGKHSEIKDFVEALFAMPKHLRPEEDHAQEAAPVASSLPGRAEPFDELCPGCGERVTHHNASCPSCGLRLL